MTPIALREVEAAVRDAWAADTCDPVDVADWSPDNPARGQCGSTALVLHDLLGGVLLLAEVRNADGSLQGYHYWNRLADDIEVDLTGEQFHTSEAVREPKVVVRTTALPARGAEQYLLLRARVTAALAANTVNEVTTPGIGR
ncbi:MAG TPA: hypothetical protein VGD55_00305 [Acidothermaceae bacterium]